MAIVLNGSTGISAPDIDSSGKVVTQDEVRAEVVAYGSNQNEPYMVAASTSYTGATTNWGTYGFQHRLKSDGSGVVRITADSKDGEAYSLSEAGNATFAGTVTATSYAGDGSALTGVGGITLATSTATNGGTSITYFSFPAGVNRITMNFDNVRQASSTGLLVQLGDSGGLETTGYVASSSHKGGEEASTTGFNIIRGSATDVINGLMIISRGGGNQWAASHACTRDTSGSTACGGGSKTLSGELTRVRLATATGGQFNLGTVSISYE